MFLEKALWIFVCTNCFMQIIFCKLLLENHFMQIFYVICGNAVCLLLGKNFEKITFCKKQIALCQIAM